RFESGARYGLRPSQAPRLWCLAPAERVPGTACALPGTPLRALGHPVTGGVKTPITPTRGLGHVFVATGVKTTIPAFIGFTVCLITPLPLDGLVVRRSVEPLTRTLTPAFALPCELTFSV